ncbi:MAG: rod-binding protein [Spirochaetaceae bacterium]|jgi:flagellar protein FlgJ|nr:rod-binding protein [Spirochaetaceae bacterium]
MSGITTVTDSAAYRFYDGRSSIDSLPAIDRAVNSHPDSRKPDFSVFLDSDVAKNREYAELSAKPSIEKNSKLYEQCEALETFLLKTLITGMRRTVDKSEFSKSGFAGEMYEDMLYDEYAKDFTRNAGFGLAELAYLELTGQRGKLMNNAEH